MAKDKGTNWNTPIQLGETEPQVAQTTSGVVWEHGLTFTPGKFRYAIVRLLDADAFLVFKTGDGDPAQNGVRWPVNAPLKLVIGLKDDTMHIKRPAGVDVTATVELHPD